MTGASLESQICELLKGMGSVITGLVGASSDEVELIEERSQRPLPPFYRWFLRTMGRDMGALTTGFDMTVGMVLSLYDAKDDVLGSDWNDLPRVCIGYLPEYAPGEGAILSYDLNHTFHDDAAMRLGSQFHAASLAEWIAYVTWTRFGMRRYTAKCKGWFSDPDGGDVPPRLTPLLSELGFRRLLASSDYRVPFDSSRAALALRADCASLNGSILHWHFDLAASKVVLAEILSTIAEKTSLRIVMADDSSWRPPDDRVEAWKNRGKNRARNKASPRSR